MLLSFVVADEELARHLDWVSRRRERERFATGERLRRRLGERWAGGERWEFIDGEWLRREWVPEIHEMRRRGRAPDLVVDVEGVARARALRATDRDRADAYRGLKAVEVPTAMGGTRIDYPEIPLKNADGTLSKYAKNLVDLHAPANRAMEEVSAKLDAQTEKVTLVGEGGAVKVVPARLAEATERVTGLRKRVVRKRRRKP